MQKKNGSFLIRMPYTLMAAQQVVLMATIMFSWTYKEGQLCPAQAQATVLMRYIGLVLVLYSIFQPVSYSAGQVPPA